MYYSLIKKSLSLLKKQIFLYILCLTALTQSNMAFSEGPELEVLRVRTEFIQNFIKLHLMKTFKTTHDHKSLIKRLLKMDNYQAWPALVDHMSQDFSLEHITQLTKALQPPKGMISSAVESELDPIFEKEKIFPHITYLHLLIFKTALSDYKNSKDKNYSLLRKLKIKFRFAKNPRTLLLQDIAHKFNELFLFPDSNLNDQASQSLHIFFSTLDSKEKQLLLKLLTDELLRSIDLNPTLHSVMRKILTIDRTMSLDELRKLYKNFKLTYFKNSKAQNYPDGFQLKYVSDQTLIRLKKIVPLKTESFADRVEEIKNLIKNKDPQDAAKIAFLLSQFITTFQFEEIPENNFKFVKENEYQLIKELLLIDLREYYQHLCNINIETSNQFIKSLLEELDNFIIRRSQKLNDILKNGYYPTIHQYLNLYFTLIEKPEFIINI